MSGTRTETGRPSCGRLVSKELTTVRKSTSSNVAIAVISTEQMVRTSGCGDALDAKADDRAWRTSSEGNLRGQNVHQLSEHSHPLTSRRDLWSHSASRYGRATVQTYHHR